jgi:exosortase/archaeosortase family protein
MPDSITATQFVWFWIADGLILLTVFAPLGYLIARRKIRHPSAVFLIRFLGAFTGLLMVDLLIMWFAPSAYYQLRAGLTDMVVRVLHLGGLNATATGAVVNVPGGFFTISAGCLGDELVCTFVALVLAESAATKRQYLLGILGGLLVLAVFNVFRISISVYLQTAVGVNIHWVFYIINLGFVLVLWWMWLGRLRPRPAVSAPQGLK